MVTAIALDMTAELAPLVWGLVILLAVSGLALLASVRPRLSITRRRRHCLAATWEGARHARVFPHGQRRRNISATA